MKAISAMMLIAMVSVGGSAVAAGTNMLEVKVQGMNCSLCSEKLQSELKSLTSATSVTPKLECGAIYVETDLPASSVEAAVVWPLTSNGFNLLGVKSSALTSKQVQGLSC